MSWFLIAYAATGLSVAVSPPQKYSFAKHDKEWCENMANNEFVCEQHKKRPKLTGKVDRHLQSILEDPCHGYGRACGMLEWDVKHGLPLGTTSTRFWNRSKE